MADVHLVAVLVMLSYSLAPSTGMRVLHAGATTFNATSAYYDGQGTYVGSDNVRSGRGYKCWSDYFVVDQGYQPGNWQRASGELYCTGTSDCQFTHMDGYSKCETWSIEVSIEAEASILKFSVSAGFSYEKCMTADDVSSCSWTDQQCHCIWARPNLAYQDGYRRDRCNRGKGDKTENMVDFHHQAPSSFDYGCGSKCTDTAANLDLLKLGHCLNSQSQ